MDIQPEAKSGGFPAPTSAAHGSGGDQPDNEAKQKVCYQILIVHYLALTVYYLVMIVYYQVLTVYYQVLIA